MERGSLFCGLKIEWEVVIISVDDLYHHLSIQAIIQTDSITRTKYCEKPRARHAALDLWRNTPRGMTG